MDSFGFWCFSQKSVLVEHYGWLSWDVTLTRHIIRFLPAKQQLGGKATNLNRKNLTCFAHNFWCDSIYTQSCHRVFKWVACSPTHSFERALFLVFGTNLFRCHSHWKWVFISNAWGSPQMLYVVVAACCLFELPMPSLFVHCRSYIWPTVLSTKNWPYILWHRLQWHSKKLPSYSGTFLNRKQTPRRQWCD